MTPMQREVTRLLAERTARAPTGALLTIQAEHAIELLRAAAAAEAPRKAYVRIPASDLIALLNQIWRGEVAAGHTPAALEAARRHLREIDAAELAANA